MAKSRRERSEPIWASGYAYLCLYVAIVSNWHGNLCNSQIPCAANRKFFGESATRKCHQGKKSRQTATKVSDLIAYNKYNCFSNKKLHINMQAQRKESVVQREVFRHKASDCKQKSRKPSKVCGANQNDNHLAFKTNGKSKGLITPATEHNNKCNKRCQKIRRLVKKFRQRRQENLGIKSENSRNSQVQQNNEEQPNGARPSIEELLNIDSTSESSSDEFGGNLSAGVAEERQRRLMAEMPGWTRDQTKIRYRRAAML